MIIIVIDGDGDHHHGDGDDDDGDEVRIEMIKCKTISEKMKMGRDSHHEKHANTAVLLQIKKTLFSHYFRSRTKLRCAPLASRFRFGNIS